MAGTTLREARASLVSTVDAAVDVFVLKEREREGREKAGREGRRGQSNYLRDLKTI